MGDGSSRHVVDAASELGVKSVAKEMAVSRALQTGKSSNTISRGCTGLGWRAFGCLRHVPTGIDHLRVELGGAVRLHAIIALGEPQPQEQVSVPTLPTKYTTKLALLPYCRPWRMRCLDGCFPAKVQPSIGVACSPSLSPVSLPPSFGAASRSCNCSSRSCTTRCS